MAIPIICRQVYEEDARLASHRYHHIVAIRSTEVERRPIDFKSRAF